MHSRLARLAILAIGVLPAPAAAALPLDDGTPPAAQEIPPPRTPILTQAFRLEVERELGGVPDPLTSESTPLEAFATLVRRTRQLSDVARASYLEWVARVYQWRKQPSAGLPHASEALRLRHRALGAGHPLCAETQALIGALQGLPLLPPKKDPPAAEEPVEVPPHVLPAELVRARLALSKRDPGEMRHALERLRDRKPSIRPLRAGMGKLSAQEYEEWALVARLLVATAALEDAEVLGAELSEAEREDPTLGADGTLLLSDLLFDSGRLDASETALFGPAGERPEHPAPSVAWRAARIASSRGDRTALDRLDRAVGDLAGDRSADSAKVLAARLAQAECELEARRLDRALEEAGIVSEQRLRTLGAEHPDTLDSERLSARIQALSGDHYGARAQLSRLYSLATETLGERAPLTLDVTLDLACTLSEGPRFREDQAFASELFSRAIAGCSELYGPEDARTLAARHELARHRVREGRPSSAAPILRSVAEARERRLGERHPKTLETLLDLATVLDGQGKTSEATSLHLAIVERARTGLGSTHPLTLEALRDLGDHYRVHSRLEEEEAVRSEVLAALVRARGEEHPETRAARRALERVRHELGRAAEAVDR